MTLKFETLHCNEFLSNLQARNADLFVFSVALIVDNDFEYFAISVSLNRVKIFTDVMILKFATLRCNGSNNMP